MRLSILILFPKDLFRFAPGFWRRFYTYKWHPHFNFYMNNTYFNILTYVAGYG